MTTISAYILTTSFGICNTLYSPLISSKTNLLPNVEINMRLAFPLIISAFVIGTSALMFLARGKTNEFLPLKEAKYVDKQLEELL